MPYLSKRKRGPKPRVPLDQMIMTIHYRLKTGCQWRELPMNQFIENVTIGWKTIYHHFRKWCKDGSWKRVWFSLLARYKAHLDLSSAQLDGSQTPCKGGGEAVGYQGRKASNTTNSLFIADNSGQMIAMSIPQDGSHHDLFEIEKTFKEMINQLESAGIDTRGVFLNADAGFDSKQFRGICAQEEIEANIKTNVRNNKKDDLEDHYFDEELYKRRTAIERANAWIDGFKALIVRFEKTVSSWMGLHWIAFSTMFINRINKTLRIT
jgi:transposase